MVVADLEFDQVTVNDAKQLNDFGAYTGGRSTIGHPTPNIDRIAKEGTLLTNWYGQCEYRCQIGRPQRQGSPGRNANKAPAKAPHSKTPTFSTASVKLGLR